MLFIHFDFEGIRTVGILIKNTKDYSPGDVFYYKSKKKTYGLLDIVCDNLGSFMRS